MATRSSTMDNYDCNMPRQPPESNDYHLGGDPRFNTRARPHRTDPSPFVRQLSQLHYLNTRSRVNQQPPASPLSCQFYQDSPLSAQQVFSPSSISPGDHLQQQTYWYENGPSPSNSSAIFPRTYQGSTGQSPYPDNEVTSTRFDAGQTPRLHPEQPQRDMSMVDHGLNPQSQLYAQQQGYTTEHQRTQQHTDPFFSNNAAQTVTNPQLVVQWMAEQQNQGPVLHEHDISFDPNDPPSLVFGGDQKIFPETYPAHSVGVDPQQSAWIPAFNVGQLTSRVTAGAEYLLVQHPGVSGSPTIPAATRSDEAKSGHGKPCRNLASGPATRKKGPAEKCIHFGKDGVKCHGRNTVSIGGVDVFCRRHYEKFCRDNAGPPSFNFPARIQNYEDAIPLLYPPQEPIIPDEELTREQCAEWEHETVRRFIDAIDKPWAGQGDSEKVKQFYERQQIELNGKAYSERETTFSDKMVNARMRFLYRGIVNLHCGGVFDLPIGGDNGGFGEPDKTLRFAQRIDTMIEFMGINKRVCMDIIQGRGALAFVGHPIKYEKRKTQNMDSNWRKQLKHALGSRVEEIAKTEGNEGDEILVTEELAKKVTGAQQTAAASTDGRQVREGEELFDFDDIDDAPDADSEDFSVEVYDDGDDMELDAPTAKRKRGQLSPDVKAPRPRPKGKPKRASLKKGKKNGTKASSIANVPPQYSPEASFQNGDVDAQLQQMEVINQHPANGPAQDADLLSPTPNTQDEVPIAVMLPGTRNFNHTSQSPQMYSDSIHPADLSFNTYDQNDGNTTGFDLGFNSILTQAPGPEQTLNLSSSDFPVDTLQPHAKESPSPSQIDPGLLDMNLGHDASSPPPHDAAGGINLEVLVFPHEEILKDDDNNTGRDPVEIEQHEIEGWANLPLPEKET